MQQILQHFHHDHIAMQRMVNILDREAEFLRDPNDDPDYHLLLDIVEGFLGPKQHHHYEEERKLHDCLRYAMPEVTPIIDRLDAEQDLHDKLGQQLTLLLKASCSGHLVPRFKLNNLIEEFIAHLNSHIKDEESLIIANAEQWVVESERSKLEIAVRLNMLP